MTKRILILAVLVFLCAAIVRDSRAQVTPTVSIPITVTDYANVDRANTPITSGVPIPASSTGDAWSLVNGNTNIPLQTKVLPGQHTPWLLLDFPATVAHNATTTYTLQNTSVAPTAGITYQHTSSSETITTGPLQVVIGTSPFLGITSLAYDANSNGIFEAGEKSVNAGSANALQVVDAETSQTISANATPTSVAWEDQGNRRGTLRIDGTFTESASTLLAYTLRITAWANRSDLGFDLLLKNSNATTAKLVKVSSAKLHLGTSSAVVRGARTGDTFWGMVDTSGTQIEFLPTTEQVSTAYDPTQGIARQTTLFNVDTNGGLVIGDLSYQGGTAHILANPSASTAQQNESAATAVSPLMARAAPDWYSSQGAFGLQNFGTLNDELAGYAAWQWTYPTPGVSASNIPHIARPANWYPSWSVIDGVNDPEGDSLWQNIIMYTRLGDQGYLDKANGWARYVTWQWPYRTDNFIYFDHDYWDGPHAVNRGIDTAVTGATAHDNERINNDIRFGRIAYDHSWVGGLVDYYYLTGSREALQSAIDIVEECRNQNDWLVAGSPGGAIGSSPRGHARCWLNTLRVWEATGDAQWQTAIDHYRALFMQSLNYSAAYGYHDSTCGLGTDYCNRWPNGQFISPFQMGDMIHAMYLDWTYSQDTALRARMIELATNAQQYAIDPVNKSTGDYIVFDSPTNGTITHASYSVFRGTTPTTVPSYAGSSLSYLDLFDIAYRLSGNLSYLKSAKTLYGSATKRYAAAPYDQIIANSHQVGLFAGAFVNSYFAEDLTYDAMFLHDLAQADDISPSQTIDLH